MAVTINSNGTITGIAAGGLPDGVVDADTLADNAVTTAKINADAVTAAKVADDVINSEHLVDGGVDNAHLASGVDAAKVTTGTLPMARLSGTLPALNGSALTSLPAATSVAFPATQVASSNANTLDDYEEGSWTPGFQTGSPTYGTTYARVGRYTKIGRHVLVAFTLYVGVLSFSDATARMEIGPLPFTGSTAMPSFGMGGTCDTFNYGGWSTGTYNNGSLGARSINAQIEGNSTVIKIRVCDETSSQYYLRNAAALGGGGSGGGSIRATVWYMA